MGLCTSDDKNSQEDVKNITIQKRLEDAQQKDQKLFKLLLLGAGESGKSTLFKQISSLYKEETVNFNDSLPNIIDNIFVTIQALAYNADRYGDIPADLHEIYQIYNKEPVFNQGLDDQEGGGMVRSLNMQQAEQISKLWQADVVQETWKNRSQFLILESGGYFLNKVLEIAQPGYAVTREDYLRVRASTSGIVESTFEVDKKVFKLFDVGGQRNERKKWIHCFDAVTAVIFVAAISEYDQKLFEEATVNRMDEAVRLFEEISNSRWFKETSILLFLNKSDLFQEKIMHSHLADHFPEYPGPKQDVQAAQEWITDLFKSKVKSKTKTVYCHITCATDVNNIRNVFNVVKDIIIREALGRLGLLS